MDRAHRNRAESANATFNSLGREYQQWLHERDRDRPVEEELQRLAAAIAAGGAVDARCNDGREEDVWWIQSDASY